MGSFSNPISQNQAWEQNILKFPENKDFSTLYKEFSNNFSEILKFPENSHACKMLHDARVVSAFSYVRTCWRVRHSKKNCSYTRLKSSRYILLFVNSTNKWITVIISTLNEAVLEPQVLPNFAIAWFLTTPLLWSNLALPKCHCVQVYYHRSLNIEQKTVKELIHPKQTSTW